MPFVLSNLSSIFGKKCSIAKDGAIEELSCRVCGLPYDMGKKRKLQDVCGHQRCYTCVYEDENCQLCGGFPAPPKKSVSKQKLRLDHPTLRNSSPVPTRSLVKTNGHLTLIKARVEETPSVVSSYQTRSLKTMNSPLTRQRSPLATSVARTVNLSFRPRLSSPDPDEGFEDLRQQQMRAKRAWSCSWDPYNRLGLFLGQGGTEGKRRLKATRSTTSLQSSLGSSETNSFGNENQISPPSTLNGSSGESEAPRNEMGSGVSLSSETMRRSSYAASLAEFEETPGNSTWERRSEVKRRSRAISQNPIETPILAIDSTISDWSGSEVVPLKPLFFEVASEEVSGSFVGRDWIFQDMGSFFPKQRGSIVVGRGGTGKTSVVLQLVEGSCFGRHGLCSPTAWYEESNQALVDLSQRVVAYHFCQVENSATCLVPEFVHSLAAQLCQAPQLAPFRTYLQENPGILNELSMDECTKNPSCALMKGILEPLNFLHRNGAFGKLDFALILIDSICEAEYHRSDSGDTISSFLAKHILKVPGWLKLVITVQTAHQDLVSLIPFQRICLDTLSDEVCSDLLQYTTERVKQSSSLRTNLSIPTNPKGEATWLINFTNYLTNLSSGSFLHTKLTLDLIQQGHLIIKSSSFKVVPVSLSELFLLHCNLRFPTSRAYEKIEPILSTCLAALNPMSLLEIYHSVNSLNASENITWEQFLHTFKALAGLLVKRSDGTFMFFHSSFRDWLLRRDPSDTKKFLCDTRIGHAAISFRLSRIEAPLGSLKTLELGHHILKANIYRNAPPSKMAFPSRDVQALWMANSSKDLSKALASTSNIYFSNMKVSRLLLLAGASPNAKTDLYGKASLLSVCAAEGELNMMDLLIEFGANFEEVNEDGDNALHLAAAHGQLEAAQLLVDQGALMSTQNSKGETALVKAASQNQLQLATFFLSFNWEENPLETIRTLDGLQQSLVRACAKGHNSLAEFILHRCPAIDEIDTLHGETPLTAAASTGALDLVQLLIKNGAKLEEVNAKGAPPLLLAAQGGHVRVVEELLGQGASSCERDAAGRTALMAAAKEGHVDVLRVLLDANCEVNTVDRDGLSALGWASLRGEVEVVELLLDHNADANQADVGGRTALDLASYAGSDQIAHMLLEKGALLEHVDLQGVRPLDRAVGCGHKTVVHLFLKRGAKLGPATWAMATGKPDIILTLLNKLLEDGNVLCKKGQLKDAAYRYTYALRKSPVKEYEGEMAGVFETMKLTFLLQLSRCKRKMNVSPPKFPQFLILPSQEVEEAIDLASRVIRAQPDSFKAYYTRAKAYQKMREIGEAAADVTRAMELVGQGNESRRQLFRLKEELSRERRSRNSPFPLADFKMDDYEITASDQLPL